LMDEIKKDVFQPALRFSDKCKCLKKWIVGTDAIQNRI
jgi:hypothetical protein